MRSCGTSKAETLDCIKKFDLEVATRHHLTIGTIRSDNGSEFKNKATVEYTAKRHITVEYSPVYTPELNGTAERMMRTLMNTTRSKLFHSQLPKDFWSSALLSTAHVRNMVGPAGMHSTPYELFYGVKPDYSSLRVYGSPSFIHVDPRANLVDHPTGDLEWRAYPAIFIGYAPDSPAWLFWDVKARKVRSASYFHATVLEQYYRPADTHFTHPSVTVTTDGTNISYDGHIKFDQNEADLVQGARSIQSDSIDEAMRAAASNNNAPLAPSLTQEAVNPSATLPAPAPAHHRHRQ